MPDQVSGAAAERFQAVEKPDTDRHAEPDYEPAEKLIAATGADIRHGGNRAFYSLAGDFICLPPKYIFIGGAYYPTALHELAHWCECGSVGRKKDGYAMGELIAEMSSCFLAAELGIPNTEALENHASLLKNWLLQAMKDDPNYIFKASRQAQSLRLLLSFVKQDATEAKPELVEAA